MISFRNSLRFLILGGCLAGACLSSTSVRAEVPRDLEADYSEAVLAFNAKDYLQSLKILDQLLIKSPGLIDLLELKALALKASGKDIESADIYQALITAKTKDQKPPSVIAPYAFELGMIRFKEKKYDLAIRYIRYAKDAGFNGGAASFYLGLMAFQSGRWGESEDEFGNVLTSKSAEDLKPVAHFYLAQSYLNTGDPSGSIQSFLAAQSSSEAILNDPQTGVEAKQIAKQIHEGTEIALKPFDRANLFASVTALTGYDSNALAIPDAVTAPLQTTGKSTFKENFSGTFGYASSPLQPFQIVPSYHGSMTKNFNSDSRAAEFADSTVSFYLTRSALARTNYGAKAEGTIVFQDQADAGGSYAFHQYNSALAFGPYLKSDVARRVTVGTEVVLRKQAYAAPVTAGNLDQAGTVISPRFYVQNNAGRRFWNPTLTLRFDQLNAVGADYQGNIMGVQLMDGLNLGDKLFVSLSVDYSRSAYPNRVGGARNDSTTLLALSASRKLTKHWSAVASGDYTKNASNLESTYTFNRGSMNLGATYSFF